MPSRRKTSPPEDHDREAKKTVAETRLIAEAARGVVRASHAFATNARKDADAAKAGAAEAREQARRAHRTVESVRRPPNPPPAPSSPSPHPAPPDDQRTDAKADAPPGQ
jgi:hypothetical protein